MAAALKSIVAPTASTLSNPTLEAEVPIEIFPVPQSRSVHGNAFPLGIRVKEGHQFQDIDAAVRRIEELAQTGLFDGLLQSHGTILFRGFPVKTASDFSKFVKAFRLPQPHREIGLSGKRTTINDAVKTANEEPPDVKFYYHSEYGRSAHFPGVLFFFSEIVPEQGGQTPLLSSLELYDRLRAEMPEFAHDLETKVSPSSLFAASGKIELNNSRQDSYGFDIQAGDSLDVQRSKVEAVLKQDLQAEAEWQPNGALHVLQKLPAIRRIQSTGKATFFNGFAGVYGRARDNDALKSPYRGLDGKYHLPTTYGDGSPIPTAYLDRLLDLSDEIGFLVPWEAGDVALIDNYTVQHARSPWVGKRSLLVSLWDGREKFAPF
ncbi:hypothetical protein A1O3_03026 [Capronia epimyces CBS 606.96]|uniref:TauD/TfdA-like domain-containing protein n=1 Tax=Capronia epimyces CBS 606.96 TaxID=1182542 RepID=W9Z645_9EURO|nr:uncharacterized protein A1O3_03026 [Capronia epimyces CBS 606.96]EXJ89959.1 hypothetical protein A1O3_03026 [Capronia epimyces CBS 606.96]